MPPPICAPSVRREDGLTDNRTAGRKIGSACGLAEKGLGAVDTNRQTAHNSQRRICGVRAIIVCR